MAVGLVSVMRREEALAFLAPNVLRQNAEIVQSLLRARQREQV
jgi:hypothetical protein